MNTLSNRQLADLLSPLWDVAPEARPQYECARLEVGAHGEWQLNRWQAVPIGRDVARDLILARLQLAIEKRVASIDYGWMITEHLTNGAVALTVKRMDSTNVAVGYHPDHIIARAMLLAKIVGVALQIPEAPERAATASASVTGA